MSLEASLKTLLASITAGGVHPDKTPPNPVFPLIIYQQVGGQAIDFGEKVLPDHDHARVQILVWARTRLEASSIARQVRAAIIGSPLAAETYAAPVSQYQEELDIYGNRTDYGIWYEP
jgi:hypothetical protein